MRIRGSSNTNTRLSPLEMLYGSPFLTPDLIYDTHQAVKYIINLGELKKYYRNMEIRYYPLPRKNYRPLSLGDWVLLKIWKEG